MHPGGGDGVSDGNGECVIDGCAHGGTAGGGSRVQHRRACRLPELQLEGYLAAVDEGVRCLVPDVLDPLLAELIVHDLLQHGDDVDRVGDLLLQFGLNI